MKKINKKSLILIFLILPGLSSNSQDKPVVISNKVGAEIDVKENEKFNLFPLWENFNSAVFYKTNDSGYYVKIKRTEDGKSLKDTIVDLSERNIFNFAYRIEYADELSQGYMPPEGKYTLDTANNMFKVTISGTYRDLFPFVKPGKKLPLLDPFFGFGISYSYAFVDLSPVASFFRNVEGYFQKQGYNVPSNNTDFNTHHMYMFNCNFRLFKTLSLEVEAGKSPGDIDLWYAGMYFNYIHKFKNLRWFRPQIAAGLASYSYYTEHKYGTIIDPENGGVLDKIVCRGGGRGFILKMGLDIGIETGQTIPIALNVSLSRSFFPEITNSMYGYMTRVNFSSFRFSTGMRIYI
jgi:hypothetical protein